MVDGLLSRRIQRRRRVKRSGFIQGEVKHAARIFEDNGFICRRCQSILRLVQSQKDPRLVSNWATTTIRSLDLRIAYNYYVIKFRVE